MLFSLIKGLFKLCKYIGGFIGLCCLILLVTKQYNLNRVEEFFSPILTDLVLSTADKEEIDKNNREKEITEAIEKYMTSAAKKAEPQTEEKPAASEEDNSSGEDTHQIETD